MIPKTYRDWFTVLEVVSANCVQGPFSSAVLASAARAGLAGGLSAAAAVLDADANDSLRGIAEGAFPL